MSDPASLITARFAKIQSNREATIAVTLASSDENRRATDAAGAAVHAKARSRLSALSRRSTDRRQGWGTDDELQGRDWLR